jgi:hypothetical protein
MVASGPVITPSVFAPSLRLPALDSGRGRAIRHGLSVAGLILSGYMLLTVAPIVATFGFDAYSYWIPDLSQVYPVGVHYGNLNFFAYSPPIAQLLSLAGGLQWWVFLYFWTALLFATLVWLGGRWTLAWLCFLPVVVEFYHGNIHLLLAAAIVLGFRYPVTWTFVVLTKITPGVGLLWFAVRREWKPLAIVAVATVTVVAISFVTAADLWGDYFRVLTQEQLPDCAPHCIPIPLWIRFPIAVAIVVVGALAGKRWTVVVGSMVALPVFWAGAPAMLAGAAALWMRDRPPKPAVADGDAGAGANPGADANPSVEATAGMPPSPEMSTTGPPIPEPAPSP